MTNGWRDRRREGQCGHLEQARQTGVVVQLMGGREMEICIQTPALLATATSSAKTIHSLVFDTKTNEANSKRL
jgi:hypothetical protein